MSANIESMFYAGKEKPWHGLGVQVPAELNASEAIKAAGLDWKVEKKAVRVDGGEIIADTFATVRTDRNEVLGVVGDVYRPLQNSEAFSFADGIIQEKGAVYHTAGSLGHGEKVWVLAKLDGVCQIKGDDIVEKYLLLSNSHDGSSGVRVCLTPIRVVCQNTLNQAIKGAENLFKIRHTASMGDKVTAARTALGLANKFFAEFEEKARAMASTAVNAQGLTEYLKLSGFDVEADKGRAKGQIDDLTRLFESGQGQNLAGAKGTVWGAYNAVTEYLTHERGTRITNGYKTEQEARLNSLWFGSGQAVNQKAWNAALTLV